MTTAQNDLMTVSEAAAFLRRSRASLDIWRCRRLGPAYLKTCGKILYRRSDLETFLTGSLIEPDKLGARPAKSFPAVPKSTGSAKNTADGLAAVVNAPEAMILPDGRNFAFAKRRPRSEVAQG